MAEKQYSNEDDKDQRVNENGICLKFANIDKSNRKVFLLSPYDPLIRHRVVYPGLNLQGTCRNQDCKVFEKAVWVGRGFGTFHIGEEITRCECPICNRALPDETVISVGYFLCKVKIQGKKQGAENNFQWDDQQTEGKLVKFQGYVGKTENWTYLKITVTNKGL